MTEGIIQKVFRINNLEHIKKAGVRRGFDIWVTEDIEKIQQELIAEIKKIHMHNPYYNYEGDYFVEEVKKRLIGDTE